MPTLRSPFNVDVEAADDLGNLKALTAAGTLPVSRWAFSYDGGSKTFNASTDLTPYACP